MLLKYSAHLLFSAEVSHLPAKPNRAAKRILNNIFTLNLTRTEQHSIIRKKIHEEGGQKRCCIQLDRLFFPRLESPVLYIKNSQEG